MVTRRSHKMKYEEAPDVKELAEKIIDKLDMHWIDKSRMLYVRSYGSKSNAIARVHALSKAWQIKFPAHYLIEVIAEKYDHLDEEEKVKVIIHELLHIPKTFGGGFRHHKNWVTKWNVEKHYRKFIS